MTAVGSSLLPDLTLGRSQGRQQAVRRASVHGTRARLAVVPCGLRARQTYAQYLRCICTNKTCSHDSSHDSDFRESRRKSFRLGLVSRTC
eukprot:scaffold59749_cov73-Phaeocystis_antarctica.AAC.4